MIWTCKWYTQPEQSKESHCHENEGLFFLMLATCRVFLVTCTEDQVLTSQNAAQNLNNEFLHNLDYMDSNGLVIFPEYEPKM
jgi:hypothetical protein